MPVSAECPLPPSMQDVAADEPALRQQLAQLDARSGCLSDAIHSAPPRDVADLYRQYEATYAAMQHAVDDYNNRLKIDDR